MQCVLADEWRLFQVLSRVQCFSPLELNLGAFFPFDTVCLHKRQHSNLTQLQSRITGQGASGQHGLSLDPRELLHGVIAAIKINLISESAQLQEVNQHGVYFGLQHFM